RTSRHARGARPIAPKPVPDRARTTAGLFAAGDARVGRTRGWIRARGNGGGTAAGAGADGPAVLTIRLINSGERPINLWVAQDINEMMHVRKLGGHRTGDGDERVKLFRVGQMPLCSETNGAGYGGIGQPARRMLQPAETMDFVWDGQVRSEELQPNRGVC